MSHQRPNDPTMKELIPILHERSDELKFLYSLMFHNECTGSVNYFERYERISKMNDFANSTCNFKVIPKDKRFSLLRKSHLYFLKILKIKKKLIKKITIGFLVSPLSVYFSQLNASFLQLNENLARTERKLY